MIMKEKKKAGRPKLKESQKRPHMFGIMMSTKEHDRVKMLAEEQGITMADYIRGLIF